MAVYTAPSHVTSGAASSSQFNAETVDNITYLHDQTVPAWTSYTPTLTQSGAVTKTVNYAKYLQMGKTVFCSVTLTCTGSGTANNAITVGLPVTAASVNQRSIGHGLLVDSSTSTLWTHTARLQTTTTVWLWATGAGALAQGVTAAPFAAALATGDSIEFTVTYEAA